jgi:hypothetical protein
MRARIAHAVGKSANPPHDWNRAITHGIHLGQATWLETGPVQENVTGCMQAVRVRLIIADLH